MLSDIVVYVQLITLRFEPFGFVVVWNHAFEVQGDPFISGPRSLSS